MTISTVLNERQPLFYSTSKGQNYVPLSNGISPRQLLGASAAHLLWALNLQSIGKKTKEWQLVYHNCS